MLRIAITHKGKPFTTREYDKAEVTIGRNPGNDIVLATDGVSKNHAQLLYNFTRQSVVVIDRRTTNGTVVNGKPIEGPHALLPGETVSIADFTLAVSVVGEIQEPSRTEIIRPGTLRKAKAGEKEKADFDAFGDSQVIGEEPWDAAAETTDLAALKAATAAPSPLSPTAVLPLAEEVTRNPAADLGAADSGLRRVVACLERYVKLDDIYRAEVFKKPCACGTCLLCESKAALELVRRRGAPWKS